jgi:8-oxo-dGTP pyrophosphatase MutT (NUDIX family)
MNAPKPANSAPMKPKRASSVVIAAPQHPRRGLKKTSSSRYGDDNHPFRILMIKRSGKTSHMSEVLVFPGGSVDENDYPIPIHNHSAEIPNQNSSKLDGQLDLLIKSGRPLPLWEGQHDASPLLPSTGQTISHDDSQSPLNLSCAYAHRSTALREIFEESGLLAVPHNSAIDLRGTKAPLFLPVDLDHQYQRAKEQANSKLVSTMSPLLTLSQHLQVPIHEVFRRIIHLNDQSVMDSIFSQMSLTNSPSTQSTFVDYCKGFNILSNLDEPQSKLSIFDSLIPLSKWISPLAERKRFDTNFYLSVIDPDQISFCPYPQASKKDDENTQHVDILDDITSHFKTITQIKDKSRLYTKTDGSSTPSSDEKIGLTNQQVQDKLLYSTLGQEIDNIAWVSPWSVLSRLDTVTLAPPTQYVLSQLAGMTDANELKALVSSPQTSSYTIDYEGSHIGTCPRRLQDLSVDPYTISTLISRQHSSQQPSPSQPKFVNPYFPSSMQKFRHLEVPTKGYVLLPGDLSHPLTNQLLLRALSLYENGVSQTHLKPLSFHEYGEFAQYGTLSPATIQGLGIEQIKRLILNDMAPPIKLGAVNLYHNPIDMLRDSEQHFQVSISDFTGVEGEFLSKFFQTSASVQEKMAPLVHFHRVVDSLTHNNWEIVASNPLIVSKTKNEVFLHLNSLSSEARL